MQKMILEELVLIGSDNAQISPNYIAIKKKELGIVDSNGQLRVWKQREYMYHEAISEELDATVAEGGGGELGTAKVAGEDTSGHGHEVVDDVNEDSGSGEEEKELELDEGGKF